VKSKKENFRNLSFSREIRDQIDVFIAENAHYGYISVAQFVEEAAKLRLATLKGSIRYAIVDLEGNILKGKLVNKKAGQKVNWNHWKKQISPEMVSQLLRDGHAVFRNLALTSNGAHIDVEAVVVKFKGRKAFKVTMLDIKKPHLIIH
jgi:hypothetical protein